MRSARALTSSVGNTYRGMNTNISFCWRCRGIELAAELPAGQRVLDLPSSPPDL
jgi:hypothetical protein